MTLPDEKGAWIATIGRTKVSFCIWHNRGTELWVATAGYGGQMYDESFENKPTQREVELRFRHKFGNLV